MTNQQGRECVTVEFWHCSYVPVTAELAAFPPFGRQLHLNSPQRYVFGLLNWLQKSWEREFNLHAEQVDSTAVLGQETRKSRKCLMNYQKHNKPEERKNHIWGLFYVSIGSPRELCDYKERKWRLGIKIDSIYFLDTHSLIHIMLRTISQIHTLGFTENKLSVNSNENGEEFWSRILVMVPLMILVLLRSKYLEKTNSFCWQLMTVSDFNKSMFKTNLVKNVYKDFYKRHKCNPITGSNYILNIRTICLRPHWLHW